MSAEARSEALTSLAFMAHMTALNKGFWEHLNTDDTKFYLAEKLALAHSELSEALAADRDKRSAEYERRYNILEELADCIIRILDLAHVVSGTSGDDIGGILIAKMVENDMRPPLHAKRY